MLVPVMAGVTGYIVFCIDIIIGETSLYLKILFVDLRHHFHHVAGYFFLRIGIRSEIQLPGIDGGLGMTVFAFKIERVFEVVHNSNQSRMVDVFR